MQAPVELGRQLQNGAQPGPGRYGQEGLESPRSMPTTPKASSLRKERPRLATLSIPGSEERSRPGRLSFSGIDDADPANGW